MRPVSDGTVIPQDCVSAGLSRGRLSPAGCANGNQVSQLMMSTRDTLPSPQYNQAKFGLSTKPGGLGKSGKHRNSLAYRYLHALESTTGRRQIHDEDGARYRGLHDQLRRLIRPFDAAANTRPGSRDRDQRAKTCKHVTKPLVEA